MLFARWDALGPQPFETVAANVRLGSKADITLVHGLTVLVECRSLWSPPAHMTAAMVGRHATAHEQVVGKQVRTGAAAWTQFWLEQGPGSRCLEKASAEFHRVLEDHWQFFATAIPKGARVLDIGCGAGQVARSLALARADLRTVGIDYAEIPGGRDAPIQILSGTPMEKLPFQDASFGAAVSQFGYEYGDTHEAATELARVLAAGAPFSFLVHHSESAILTDCRAHLAALDDLIGERLGTLFMSGDAIALEQEMTQLRRRHQGESIIDQAAQGLRRHIGGSELHRAQIWRAVTDALAPAHVLEVALAKCRVAPGELESWLLPLREMFEIKAPSVVRLGDGKPMAWKIEGIRNRESVIR